MWAGSLAEGAGFLRSKKTEGVTPSVTAEPCHLLTGARTLCPSDISLHRRESPSWREATTPSTAKAVPLPHGGRLKKGRSVMLRPSLLIN